MNLPLVLKLGALIQDAYAGCYNKRGLPILTASNTTGYNVIQTIYADDLATDLARRSIDPLVDIVPDGLCRPITLRVQAMW